MDAAVIVVVVVVVVAVSALAGAAVASLVLGARLAAERRRADLAEATVGHERAAHAERLAGLEARHAEQREVLEEAQARLTDTFRATAATALEQANASLLQLAEQRFQLGAAQATAELEHRRQAVESLVRPLGDQVGVLARQLAALDRATTLLREGNESLRTETAALVQALRAPQGRGRWGELQLRRVVELAGMLERCDFSEQVTVAGAEGVQRPDLVVHLPGGGCVVVDAKAPLSAYLDAMEAPDHPSQREHLARHARQLRGHVDALSRKAYWEQFPDTPDFVVLFVPGDSLLTAAFEHDPALADDAVASKVLLATPATLIALLKTVAYGWRQEALAREAQEVARLGRSLHDRLRTFADHLDKVGRGLRGSVEAYNKAVGSLESRVLVDARRFEQLAVTDKALEAPAPVEVVPRHVAVVRPAEPSEPGDAGEARAS